MQDVSAKQIGEQTRKHLDGVLTSAEYVAWLEEAETAADELGRLAVRLAGIAAETAAGLETPATAHARLTESLVEAGVWAGARELLPA